MIPHDADNLFHDDMRSSQASFRALTKGGKKCILTKTSRVFHKPCIQYRPLDCLKLLEKVKLVVFTRLDLPECLPPLRGGLGECKHEAAMLAHSSVHR